MSEHDARRRRPVADEPGECGDADVDERLASLAALVDPISADDADDRPALRTFGDDTRRRIVGILVAVLGATRGAEA